jgi:Animal haem peroxidase
MRYSPISSKIFGLLDGSAVRLSHLIIAAALSSSVFALRPALAVEEGDGSLFRVPGEGPPYVPEYAPRAGWPPMPDRRPYSHGRRDESFGRTPEPYPRTGYEVPLQARDEAYEEPESKRIGKGHEERDEDHDRHDRAESGHDESNEGRPYAANYAEGAGKGDGFGRLFPKARSDDDTRALIALGRGMIEDGEPGDASGDTQTPAGYTFLGQFIDHDVTLDTTTQLGRQIRSDDQLVNARTPDLDLDNVYGEGPDRTPHLYRLPYIRVGRQISADGDLPRADLFRTRSARIYGPGGGEAVALVGDLRDDENIVISQLHAAFVAFHNRTADILVERDFGHDRWSFCQSGSHCDTQELADALPDAAKVKIYGIAHDHVVHYYHRIIAEDFLPHVIGPDFTDAFLKKGREFFFPDGFRDEEGQYRKPYIPVEFAAAAFRFGHSQVRDAYVLREGTVFDLLSDERGGPRAFQPVTPRFLADWRYFFEIGRERPEGFNYSRLIDTELVRSLHRLNVSNAVGKNDLGSLAARNLVRGKTQFLPSGQAVAERVLPVLQERGLIGQGGYGPRAGAYAEGWRAYLLPPSERVKYYLGNADSPLWYYVLQEASAFGTRPQPYSAPDDEDEAVSGGDYRPYRNRGSWHNASIRYEGGRGGRYDDAEGGYKLGPVGATIVGEVLTGLLEHYRETTGKGLAYEPQIRGSVLKGRYTMANFLVDAGVAERY